MLKVIFTTALLSLSVFVNANASSHVQLINASQASLVEAVMQNEESISIETLTVLIEEHASPHWKMTIAETWVEYNSGALVIIELEDNYFYRIEYTGGFLEVVLEDRG